MILPISTDSANPDDAVCVSPSRDDDAHVQARLHLRRDGFTLDVDLLLPGRGVTALFGPSGSGKTTLLRCLAGLLAPQPGYLSVNGQCWLDTARGHALPAHRRAVGYVFQDANLFAHLDVRGNLLYGYKRVARTERRLLPGDAAALLGIERLLSRMPDSLSGGERQRVGIARALLTSPRLLLMDEPLASLDDARKQEILPYLARLHAALEIPVVYVSHAAQEVARLADHLVLMRDGQAIGSGPIGATLASLALPPALSDDASVLIDGRVASHDSTYSLLAVNLPGNGATLQVVHEPMPAGHPMRVVIKARDVSLAMSRHADASILNVLPATVQESAPTQNPAHIMVRLDAAGTPLLARITRYSHEHLGLAPGKPVWAQIKSVSLLA